jgi:hypothetical protein
MSHKSNCFIQLSLEQYRKRTDSFVHLFFCGLFQISSGVCGGVCTGGVLRKTDAARCVTAPGSTHAKVTRWSCRVREARGCTREEVVEISEAMHT